MIRPWLRPTLRLAVLSALIAYPAVADADDFPPRWHPPVVTSAERLQHGIDDLRGYADMIEPAGSAVPCPGIIGLAYAAARKIRDRLVWDAQRAGVPIDTRRRCTPTFFLVLPQDNNGFIEKLRADGMDMLSQRRPEATGLLDEKAGHLRLYRGADLALPNFADASASSAKQISSLHAVAAPHRRIGALFLFIDDQLTYGKSVDQIGDYAAVRLFSDDRTASPRPVGPTILALFEAGDPPAGLTDTYLRSARYPQMPAGRAKPAAIPVTQTADRGN